jgi:hypothetical protein
LNAHMHYDKEIFPMSKCNMYGLLINCPNNPVKFLDNYYERDYKKNHVSASFRYWFPTEMVDPSDSAHYPLHASYEKTADEPEQRGGCRTEAEYAATQGPTQMEDNRWQNQLREYAIFMGRSMTCLYDRGDPSLLDTWGELNADSRKQVLTCFKPEPLS